MAQRKPEEQSTFDQVLKLVENLTPEAQEQLVEQMKLQWLRRAIDEADESLARGEVVSQEELDEHLDAVRQKIIEERRKWVGRIRFTQPSKRDFAEIYQHIAEDSIAAADEHRVRLRQRCLGLVDQPRIGTKRDQIKPGLRSVTDGDYVIFYRIEGEDNIAIMRVVHAKRDLSKIAFEE